MQDERLHQSMKSNVVPIIGHGTQATGDLKHRGFQDFLDHKYPRPEKVLAPWLPAKGLAMIAGYRGLGKTYLGLSIAYAIASGGEVLGWEAGKPRKVVYVDGEMDPIDMQDRLAAIHEKAKKDGNGNPEAALANLFLICDGDQELGMPDLAGEDGQGRKRIEAKLEEVGGEVLMLDNLSSLFRYSEAADNEQESWTIAQDWLLKLRREGYTVVFFHHTGKPDKYGHTKQRGTSKKEDILNTSILLNPPKKKDKDVISFVVEFTKNRGFVPPDDFAVKIEHDTEKGECKLTTMDRIALIKMMRDDGATQEEIARHFGVDQSTISRWEKNAAAVMQERPVAA
jgi:hypothetical protein